MMSPSTDALRERTGLERVLSWLDDDEACSDAALRAIEDEYRY